MNALWPREPVLILAAVTALLALAIGYGAPVTPVQLALILAAVNAVMALFVRSRVAPYAKVAALATDGGVVAGPAAPVDVGVPVTVAARVKHR